MYSKNKGKRKELNPNSPYWQQCKEIAVARRKLEQKMSEMKKELLSTYKLKYEIIANDYKILEAKPSRFDTEFWNSLTDEKTTFENENEYEQRGNRFRSRAEVIIAGVLDEMGLTYRYDVKVRVNGRNVFVDYVVYLPQFDRCFLIEFYGRLNDRGYARDNRDKVEDYFADRVYIGQEIVFLCGDEHRMPPAGIIKEQVEAMINGIAGSRVIKATKN